MSNHKYSIHDKVIIDFECPVNGMVGWVYNYGDNGTYQVNVEGVIVLAQEQCLKPFTPISGEMVVPNRDISVYKDIHTMRTTENIDITIQRQRVFIDKEYNQLLLDAAENNQLKVKIAWEITG